MKISKYVWEGSGEGGGSEVRDIRAQTSAVSELLSLRVILQIISAG